MLNRSMRQISSQTESRKVFEHIFFAIAFLIVRVLTIWFCIRLSPSARELIEPIRKQDTRNTWKTNTLSLQESVSKTMTQFLRRRSHRKNVFLKPDSLLALRWLPYDYQDLSEIQHYILKYFTLEFEMTPMQPESSSLVLLTPVFAESMKYLPARICLSAQKYIHIQIEMILSHGPRKCFCRKSSPSQSLTTWVGNSAMRIVNHTIFAVLCPPPFPQYPWTHPHCLTFV